MKSFLILFIFLLMGSAWGQRKAPVEKFSLNEIEENWMTACKRGEQPSCYMLAKFWLKHGKFKKRTVQMVLDGEKIKETFEVRNKKEGKASGKKLMQDTCARGEKAACTYLRGGILAGRGSDLLLYASIVLMGLSTLIIASTMFQDEDEYKAQEKLEESADRKIDYSDYGPILKYSRPFFKRYVVPIVESMKGRKKIKQKYKRKLATAGLTEVLAPEDFYSFKLFLIIGFPIVFVGVRAFLEEQWPLELMLVIGGFGYIYPDIWINSTIKKRQKEIIRSMPFAVDMLALAVEAGLDFIAAMQKVIEKGKPGPLTYEFQVVMKDIKIGASRAEALRNMVWRVDLINISSFCATLIAADSVGASIGPILKALAIEIRQKKSADVEKEGATAATKILIPMIFLIVPAVFIVIAAPMVLGGINNAN